MEVSSTATQSGICVCIIVRRIKPDGINNKKRMKEAQTGMEEIKDGY